MIVNDGEMFVNNSEMLVNDGVYDPTHIPHSLTIISPSLTSISVALAWSRYTIIRSSDPNWEAAPTALDKRTGSSEKIVLQIESIVWKKDKMKERERESEREKEKERVREWHPTPRQLFIQDDLERGRESELYLSIYIY